jgi:signal transduction histidine kinase
VIANEVLVSAIDAMPNLVLVLNPQRQILAVNTRLLEVLGVRDPVGLLGQRPGEVVGCQHVHDGPDGCGTGQACTVCGAVAAVVGCQRSGMKTVYEAKLTVGHGDGRALDLEVTASPLRIGGLDLVMVAMRDIADEKRRQVLEQLFFHDVLNTAGGINGMARLLAEAPAEDEAAYKQKLVQLSDQLIEEIASQRTLVAAEAGELVAHPEPVAIDDLLRQIQAWFSGLSVAAGRTLVLEPMAPITIATDPVLLRRVIGNLVKNALEATAPGGVVTIACLRVGDEVAFTVHNPGEIPPAVQLQLFMRSFSTKGRGRGLGTWSVKLLGERYLGGRVDFTTSAAAGTEMRFVLPMASAGRQVS